MVLDNAESKQAASLPRHTMPPQQPGPEAQGQAGDDVEQQALLQQQKQQSDALFVGQTEHQEALIQEQHEGIEEIHRDLQEVHGLFQARLGVLPASWGALKSAGAAPGGPNCITCAVGVIGDLEEAPFLLT